VRAKIAVSSDPGQILKILHIGKYFAPFNGGLENYQRDVMVALAARGIQSAALVHQHELSFTSKKMTLDVHGLQLPLVKAATWIKVLFTPISPGFCWHLRRLIKSFKPDVLHLHMPNPSAFWALFLPAARKLPWVIHWHSDVITEQHDWKMKFFYQIYRHFERAVLQRANAIVVTSPPYLESSLPLKSFRNKCLVVPLGVDTGRLLAGLGIEKINKETEAAHLEQSLASDKQDVQPAPLQVLAIGRLTYYKGFNYLIEAIALAPHTHLQLVGSGEQEQTLRSLAASLNVSERVTFHGQLSGRQLAQQFIDCDCLCLPSIERTEAFGMVLLEAQYFAKATIIADVSGSGMGWVVDDQLTGLKVPPADAQELADALLYLQQERTELIEMGKRGKQKFETVFEINHAVETLIDVYDNVIHAHPGKSVA
jgi:rhamnosyl/mannosyltransferase